ncbi:hypothetical protein FKR81_01880 [Lentzea tibetensis]|uniref:Uncharacterized protein n=1 Tax=Lentzea tibetensis TaxID=2591470 RepID=A0A563F2Y1_9PSEU|nr:hypothetical protein [Lentzea tibetensis]TWP54327.1 hypothetical protein FKR81_01880 [Lentzea tibetensis]
MIHCDVNTHVLNNAEAHEHAVANVELVSDLRRHLNDEQRRIAEQQDELAATVAVVGNKYAT